MQGRDCRGGEVGWEMRCGMAGDGGAADVIGDEVW